MKILMSAYACEPHKGSEPGVGWNWAKQMSEFHNVWVITRANNRTAIEKELAGVVGDNLHFIYYDLPGYISWWKRGNRGIQLYYLLWQLGASKLAKKLHTEIGFDLGHHVTFATFRQPSFLRSLGIPYIWGPVGGGEKAPFRFYPAFGIRGLFAELARDISNWLLRNSPFVRKTMKKASIILTTTEETKRQIPKRFIHKTTTYPAIGIDKIVNKDIASKDSSSVELRETLNSSRKFRVLFVGNLLHLKGVVTAIKAFLEFNAYHPMSEFVIIGEGPERKRITRLLDRYAEPACTSFKGKMSLQKVIEEYKEYDAFLFPSFRDSGAMVVLEAISSYLPVICLDSGGPGYYLPENCAIKIALTRHDQVISDLARAMEYICKYPDKASEMAENAARHIQNNFTWSNKARYMDNLYNEVVKSYARDIGRCLY